MKDPAKTPEKTLNNLDFLRKALWNETVGFAHPLQCFLHGSANSPTKIFPLMYRQEVSLNGRWYRKPKNTGVLPPKKMEFFNGTERNENELLETQAQM